MSIDTIQNNKSCLNCGANFSINEKFCKVCGQKTSTHRFSVKSIFAHDFIHAIFHLDKGFFVTLKFLFTKPGTVVKEFLDGKRVKYFNYFTMIIILITVGHLLNLYSPIKLTSLIDSSKNYKTASKPIKIDTIALVGKKSNLDSQTLNLLRNKIDSVKKRREITIKIEERVANEQTKIFSSFERFTKENPKLFYLILLPIYTLVTFTWFYKSKLNFSEHLILNIYKTCGDIIIGSLMTLGFIIYPKTSFWIAVYPYSTLLVIVYGTWFYFHFFKNYYKERGIVFLKSLAAIITVQVILGLITAIYMIIKLIQIGSSITP